jgi:hypothetical protein
MAIYMYVPNYPGNSIQKGYEDWHILSSYSWGCETPPQPTTQVKFALFDVMLKPMESATRFMYLVAIAKRLERVIIAVTGSQGDEICRYVLSTAVFTSLNQGYSSGEVGAPIMNLSIWFQTIAYTVFIQRPDGSTFQQTNFWNIQTNSGG